MRASSTILTPPSTAFTAAAMRFRSFDRTASTARSNRTAARTFAGSFATSI